MHFHCEIRFPLFPTCLQFDLFGPIFPKEKKTKKKNGPIFPEKEKERKKQNFFQDFKGILAKSLENLTFLGQFFQKKKTKKTKNGPIFPEKEKKRKKQIFPI